VPADADLDGLTTAAAGCQGCSLYKSLGAVAGKALLGPSFRVTKQRGVLMPRPAIGDLPGRDDRFLVATLHPSAIIRADDREAMYAGFLDDLKVAAQALA